MMHIMLSVLFSDKGFNSFELKAHVSFCHACQLFKISMGNFTRSNISQNLKFAAFCRDA